MIFGTTRVWYTEETRTIALPLAQTNIGAAWFTLPGNAGTPDPLPGDANADLRDSRTTSASRSPYAAGRSRDVAWVLGEGTLMRYARVPGSDDGGPPGTWSRETIIQKDVRTRRTPRAEGPMRDSAVWTDIAVNLDPPAAAGQPPRQHGTQGRGLPRQRRQAGRRRRSTRCGGSTAPTSGSRPGCAPTAPACRRR